MKIVENLYAYLWPGVTTSEMLRYGNNCNSYLITNSYKGDKHIIVDPGQVVNEAGQRCLDRLTNEMGEDGIRVEDIGLIIYTHAHPDHYEAGPAVKKMSKADIAVSREESEFMNTVGKQLAKELEAYGIKIPEIAADLYLEEGKLDFGEGKPTLKVINTPGHSHGHVSIYWPETKALFGGDLIFNGSTGRVDIPGGSAQLIKESIEKVSQLDIEYLLTGHQYGSPGIIHGSENIRRNFDFVRKNVYPYL